jgi:Flp pilus assembly protein TadB
MAENSELLARIKKLEARNKKVEADKGWETSWVRRGAIMVLTYIVVAFYLHFVVHISPWINALVPVIGFTLSTLTLSFLKARWVTKQTTQK